MNFALTYLIIINIFAGIFFYADKRRSIKGKRRIPEAILHLLELVGGIFTVIILMFTIRHKNQKWSYKIISFAILALWIFFTAVAIFRLN